MSAFQSYKTASVLFSSGSFYLTAVVCAGIVFGQDLLLLFLKVDSQKSLIERVKIGMKMGYDKSETFFRNIFASKDHVGSEDMRRSSPKREVERPIMGQN